MEIGSFDGNRELIDDDFGNTSNSYVAVNIYVEIDKIELIISKLSSSTHNRYLK